ncbi:MAG: tRNA-(ms[2]io[6]A)-hydroxylase [Deltaproteobacteria bacterium]|nr:tRNA-(ms[2]io[6]A)-hydroxylase [Deltaproteobacteria bacterium]
MRLRVATSRAWLEAVLSDFDTFMLDHALCERKASATAMSLVSHYPDRAELTREMVDLAVEELEHFRMVYRRIADRGLVLPADHKDDYVRRLRALVRRETDVFLLDRLLVSALIEARSCERFVVVSEALPAGDTKDFYVDLARAEARHHVLFTRLARTYHAPAIVEQRLDEMLDAEARIVESLPVHPFVH